MGCQTAEEAKAQYVAKMGVALGNQFAALWQELANLYLKCNEFIELFGTKPSQIELLDKAASGFFHMIQGVMWEDLLPHLARIADPPNSLKRKDKANLTIQNLPALVADETTKTAVSRLVATAVGKTSFCREWRNRHIAHRDLALALEQPAAPLPEADIAQVKEALEAFASVLNAVQQRYMDATTAFAAIASLRGATSLLYALDDADRAHKKRQERLERGEVTDEDARQPL